MIKLFRKNRQISLIEGKVVNYFKYAIGEIFLVVMCILIALYINNYNSVRLEKSAAISSYKNIKRQISDDKLAIDKSYFQNKELYEKYFAAIQIIEQNDRKKIDTLGRIALDLMDYSDIDRSGTIYQNLINSGESKLLKNREIMDHIQKLEEAKQGNSYTENNTENNFTANIDHYHAGNDGPDIDDWRKSATPIHGAVSEDVSRDYVSKDTLEDGR